MTEQRHLTAIFCDDIRREEGNKLSYMGVYEGTLLVPTLPAVLPKLCVAIRMISSPTAPRELTFKVFKDDELLAEREIPAESLKTLAERPIPEGETAMQMVATVFQLFPLELTAPCKLRVRAICDGKEFKGGSLFVDRLREVTVEISSPEL